MPGNTSSAEPQALNAYAAQMLPRDQDTAASCGPLRGVLQHFEATCRESPFALRVSHLVDPVQSHARDCTKSDDWVNWVGACFWAADQGDMGIVGIYSPPDPYGIESRAIAGSPNAIGPSFLTYLVPLLASGEDLHGALEILKDTLPLRHVLELTGKLLDNGVVTIRGGHALKEVLGLNPSWTVMKLGFGASWGHNVHVLGNLHKMALSTTPKSWLPDSKLGWAGLALTGAVSLYENYQEYGSENLTQVAVGTAVDTTILYAGGLAGRTVGNYAGGFVGGAILGAVSGGLLTPVGVAAGSAIGGVIGGVAGTWLAKKALQTNVDEWLTENISAGLEGAGAAIADATVQIVDNIGDAVQEAGNALANRAEQVSNAFGSFAGRVAALV